MGGTVVQPMPWMYQLYNSNWQWQSQMDTKPRGCYYQSCLGVLGCPKCSLTSFVMPEQGIRLPTYCCEYPPMGKTALQSLTHNQSIRSTSRQKMREKDASNPMTSLTTAIILVLTLPPQDSPLDVQSRLQRRIQQIPRSQNFWTNRPRVVSSDKWRSRDTWLGLLAHLS